MADNDSSATSGWEALPAELLHKVLAGGGILRVPQAHYWSSTESMQESKTRGVVRAVCRQWCASHDALLTRLKVSSTMLDDEGLCALLSRFPALTAINLDKCTKVTDAGLWTLGSLSTLTSLIVDCLGVTDVGTLGSLSALTSLNLTRWHN
eukprot:3064685-Pyramimonas_sp.AAC.1